MLFGSVETQEDKRGCSYVSLLLYSIIRSPLRFSPVLTHLIMLLVNELSSIISLSKTKNN
jgi:hypothetical protein